MPPLDVSPVPELTPTKINLRDNDSRSAIFMDGYYQDMYTQSKSDIGVTNERPLLKVDSHTDLDIDP